MPPACGQSSEPPLTSHLLPASVSPSCLKQRGAGGCEGCQPPLPTPPHLPGVRRLDEITSVRCRCRGRGVGWTQPAAAQGSPRSGPPPDPAAHPGDLGPSAAWDVNLGTEEGKCMGTGLRISTEVECHSSVNVWGGGFPKARPSRGQQSEGPEAPASPSSGLRSRPREWAGQGPGEGRLGGTSTPPSGLHAAASMKVVSPRSTNPVRTPLLLARALRGVQTPLATPKDAAGRTDSALTPQVSPDCGPSQVPKKPRQATGHTGLRAPRSTPGTQWGHLPPGPWGLFPKAQRTLLGLQRHPRRQGGRNRCPRAPDHPRHTCCSGQGSICRPGELLKDEPPRAAGRLCWQKLGKAGTRAPSCHLDIWDSHCQRKRPPQPPLRLQARPGGREERLPVGRPRPLPRLCTPFTTIIDFSKYQI